MLFTPRLGLSSPDALGGTEDGRKTSDEGDAQHVGFGVNVNACKPLCLEDGVGHGWVDSIPKVHSRQIGWFDVGAKRSCELQDQMLFFMRFFTYIHGQTLLSVL